MAGLAALPAGLVGIVFIYGILLVKHPGHRAVFSPALAGVFPDGEANCTNRILDSPGLFFSVPANQVDDYHAGVAP